MGKLWPRIVVMCPANKNGDSITNNLLLAPNVQIFGSKLPIFVPIGQFEPHRSMFSTRKRCLISSLVWGYQKCYFILPLPPQKKWILVPKIAKFGPKMTVLAKYWPFGPYGSTSDQKKCEQCALVVFRYVGTKTFTNSHINWIFGSKTAKFCPKPAF